MIVVAIILALLAMAAGRYERSLQVSREAVLKQDLYIMRSAIQQYTLDKQAAPQSLNELVSAGYLREIPRDPVTRQRDWRTQYEDVLLSVDQNSTGLTDVRSNSDSVALDGTPYSSW
jgi:general secretion pathway protein G